jgi:hypothetical protein
MDKVHYDVFIFHQQLRKERKEVRKTLIGEFSSQLVPCVGNGFREEFIREMENVTSTSNGSFSKGNVLMPLIPVAQCWVD